MITKVFPGVVKWFQKGPLDNESSRDTNAANENPFSDGGRKYWEDINFVYSIMIANPSVRIVLREGDMT
ncbi:hypothetical protein ACLOJK_032811 [Asimina triloba]